MGDYLLSMAFKKYQENTRLGLLLLDKQMLNSPKFTTLVYVFLWISEVEISFSAS